MPEGKTETGTGFETDFRSNQTGLSLVPKPKVETDLHPETESKTENQTGLKTDLSMIETDLKPVTKPKLTETDFGQERQGKIGFIHDKNRNRKQRKNGRLAVQFHYPDAICKRIENQYQVTLGDTVLGIADNSKAAWINAAGNLKSIKNQEVAS